MTKQDNHFDAVAWVRQVRDENYRKYEHLSAQEFVQKISEEGKNTALWKRLKERQHQARETA